MRAIHINLFTSSPMLTLFLDKNVLMNFYRCALLRSVSYIIGQADVIPLLWNVLSNSKSLAFTPSRQQFPNRKNDADSTLHRFAQDQLTE